jgi:uncharacterized membrane protein
MSRARMGIAVLSLLGLFIAIYMYLYKIGAIGALACGSGGCETVQLSPQARFLGVEVALIGVIGYATIFAVAMAGLQPRFSAAAWPGRLLFLLSAGAVLFTAYLTWLELFVIHAICRWCVGSAVVILLIFVLSLRDRRRPVASA